MPLGSQGVIRFNVFFNVFNTSEYYKTGSIQICHYDYHYNLNNTLLAVAGHLKALR